MSRFFNWWLTKRLRAADAQGVGLILQLTVAEMMRRETPKRTRVLLFDFVAKIEKGMESRDATGVREMKREAIDSLIATIQKHGGSSTALDIDAVLLPAIDMMGAQMLGLLVGTLVRKIGADATDDVLMRLTALLAVAQKELNHE